MDRSLIYGWMEATKHYLPCFVVDNEIHYLSCNETLEVTHCLYPYCLKALLLHSEIRQLSCQGSKLRQTFACLRDKQPRDLLVRKLSYLYAIFANVKFDNDKILGPLNLILWHLSLGQVAGRFTCPPQFLLVPDNRLICFFEPCIFFKEGNGPTCKILYL